MSNATTREELKNKAITMLNEVLETAAMLSQITGKPVEEVFDDDANMKFTASKLFVEALFDEEIIADEERGLMFKSDATDVGATVGSTVC